MITATTRLLRKRSTPSESKFWKIVRNRRFLGLKFLRQHPIDFEIDGRKKYFIADFCCCERSLVVEIDGGVHETQADYDKMRTHIINNLGYRVIRFKNEDIENNLEYVISELGGELERCTHPLAPSLPHKETGKRGNTHPLAPSLPHKETGKRGNTHPLTPSLPHKDAGKRGKSRGSER